MTRFIVVKQMEIFKMTDKKCTSEVSMNHFYRVYCEWLYDESAKVLRLDLSAFGFVSQLVTFGVWSGKPLMTYKEV